MSTLQWWRSWHGAPMDNKWPVIALRSGVKPGIVSAIAWALMDYASQQKDRGSLDGFDIEVYAVFSGFEEDEIKAVIKSMEDKGIITDNRLTHWEKRQPKREDNSTERVARYREVKRSVTQGNAENSPEERRVDSDKDTDKEKILSTPNFDTIKVHLEQLTGLLAVPQSINAINEIIEMGASSGDIDAGYQWFRENAGKPLKYYGQLIGPTRTAMSKRLGNGRPIPEDPRNIPTEVY
jgi:hypothetical protein